jgi:hypothetical protein
MAYSILKSDKKDHICSDAIRKVYKPFIIQIQLCGGSWFWGCSNA